MTIERDEKGKILPGTGGRPRGARNKLQADLLCALAEDFAEHGAGVIRIVRAERPHEYLRIIASILPRELHVQDATLEDLSDDDLIDAIAEIRRLRTEKGRGGARDAAATEDDPAASRH
jgi:hypothetical protein